VSARAWAGFFGLAVLWGVPYLFIKIAVDDDVPPIFLAWVRVTMGAALLLALAWRSGRLATTRGMRGWVVIYALFEICAPFPLIGWGEQHVSSSLTAILIASVPAFVALVEWPLGERLTRVRGAGIAVGFAGVVALVGLDVSGDRDELLGAGAILLASLGYAIGPVIYQRRFGGLDVPATMGAALAASALVLAPFAWLDPPDHVTGDAALSMAALGVFCTAGAFALFAALISSIGAAKTLIITYVAPVVALACGVAFLDESVGAGAIAGLVLILSGSWLATDGRLPRRRLRARTIAR
jgi:drug/metabolite transporter (DMT)-like permease